MPALDGMRVLDMTQYEAGTSCTQALAWLGAEVVKVERPGIGDPGRGLLRGEDNRPYFLTWNSNKRSIAIDLERPEGRDLLLQMLPRFDVFVENYGPGVIEKLNLGYEALRGVHPQLIYARLKGFGTSGPYANFKCMDMVAQAAGGSFSVTGYPDTPPTRPGFTVGDAGTGVQLALAITAAYVQKLRTGEGQEIEISMQEALTYYMRTTIAVRGDSGRGVAPRNGNRGDPPTDLYPCKPFGANDYVYIMVVTERMWQTLCTLIGRPDLIEDPRFATREARIEHGEALHAEITAWTSQHTKYEAMQALAEGLPAGAVLDTHDLFEDPHLNARGFVHEVQHPTEGAVRLLGFPPRLSRSEVPIEPAPLLGQHTAAVLQSELGLSESDVEVLHASGILGMPANVPAASVER